VQVCQSLPANDPVLAGQAWRLELVAYQSDLTNASGNGGQLEFAFRIVAVHSEKALDVQGNSTADHATIQQYTINGGSNQMWILGAQ